MLPSPQGFKRSKPHPRTNDYVYNPPSPQSDPYESNRGRLVPHTRTNARNFELTEPASPEGAYQLQRYDRNRHQQLAQRRRPPSQPFMVQRDTSPAHGKRVYHQGLHWKGRWWERPNTGMDFESDESYDDDYVDNDFRPVDPPTRIVRSIHWCSQYACDLVRNILP